MEKWLKISLLLCTFGFFREMRPSEPFVAEFLSGDWRNITSEDVNKKVYPLGTYSVLAQLVIVFLITDLLRYKPIIVLSAIAGIILFALLLWTRTLLELQIAQIFFGMFTAAEVAYYTYIYTKVDRERYQIVTGHTRAAILSGKFLGGVVAQILVSTNAMDFLGLHYISFATQIISLPIAFLLPSVPRSVYFYAGPTSGPVNTPDIQLSTQNERKPNQTPPVSTISSEDTPKFSLENAGRLLWNHFISSYTNPIVVQWSIWWALATCGQIQVISYIQFLWKEVAPENLSTYNGGVEAVATLLGAGGAIAAGLLNSNSRRNFYMITNSICAAVLGALMLLASATDTVLVAYINYVLFSATFFFIITVAGSIVAANLVDDSFGLVFGINTLVALALQTILTIVTVTDSGFALPPRAQYVVYGSYFLGLAVIYFVVLLLVKLFSRRVENPSAS